MSEPHRLPSGVPGLDEIIFGGIPLSRAVLVSGAPGTGKTTLALQFLRAGADRGERALFFSIAQSEEELRLIAASHGIDLAGIEVLSPEVGGTALTRGASIDTTESELASLVAAARDALERVQPALFVFDSLLELRLLAPSVVAYRHELLALRNLLRHQGTTSLLLDHHDTDHTEGHAESVVHGAIRLVAETPPIGIMQRRLSVPKMRGMPVLEGFHDFRIQTGGLRVFPRVVPSTSPTEPAPPPLASGQVTLDEILGGGLDFATTTLITGQAGAGKSTMVTLFGRAAAARGVKAALFLFEERPEIFRLRSSGLGLDLDEPIDRGMLRLRHFDPAEVSPGELSTEIIDAVENQGVRFVAIDSLSGYVNALPARDNVVVYLHQLLKYLARRGVLVVVTLAQHGLLDEPARTELDTSYLSDTIMMLRQYDTGADIRRSIAIMKKRHGPHDQMIQELVIREGAVEVNPISSEVEARTRVASRLGSD